jgi:osmoprotectant transport system ATP-binding protein
MAESSAHRAATVEFEHVSKQYDETQIKKGAPGAVNDLSFTVPAGKILTLVGPSGCGKTTSLKMVNRLIEPTSGEIRIDGQDIAKRDVTELRRSIGYVIQQIGLFPHQTIEENVGTVPRLLGWPEARWKGRASELLSLISLEPSKYAKRYPSQLSGGERQRVGVARALAADPPIMLMDEPFGAVDPIVRERLQNEFLRLQEDLAKTILFVTHDIDEAIKMGDLVAVLQVGGKLAQFGPPAEILANPASDFVARFVGADRGLKRLSLNRVDDIPLRQPAMATTSDDPAVARARAAADPLRHLLLVDDARRPIGWIAADHIHDIHPMTDEMASQSSPLFDRRTTLKDALSMLLDADVRAGIVVDRTGAVRGIITAEGIADWMRESSGSSGPAEGWDRDGTGEDEALEPVAAEA